MERDQAIKFVHELLRVMISKKASDLFITAGFPPAFKVDGKMTPVSNQSLTPTHTMELARAIMNDKQAQEFEASKECNFAISPPGIGRFRVNAFVQQARVGIVLRTITTAIPRIEDLGLPEGLKDVVMTGLASEGQDEESWFEASETAPQEMPWRLKAAKIDAACGVPLLRLPSSSSIRRNLWNQLPVPQPSPLGGAQL